MARKRDLIEEILAKIEPYSVWPLNTSGDLFLIIVQGHPLFEDFKKQILETFPRNSQLMNFKAPSTDKIRSLDHFVGRCLVCFTRPIIWTNRPTLKDFKSDIIEFRNIAHTRPKFIKATHERLVEKYALLIHVSEEYARWGSIFRPNLLCPIDDVTLSQKDLQDKVFKYTDQIIDSFPSEELQGTHEDSVVMWLARQLQQLWVSAGYDPEEPQFEPEFLRHFWRVAKLVVPRLSTTSYKDEQIQKVIRGEYKCQPHRKVYKKLPPSIYFGPSIVDIFRFRHDNAHSYSSMTRLKFTKYVIHEIIFRFRWLAHKRLGFPSPIE